MPDECRNIFDKNISFSPNYIKTCQNQTHYFNRLLKPVYSLLFQTDAMGNISAQFISNQDLQYLRKQIIEYPDLYPYTWIETSHPTFLFGNRPGGVESKENYQRI